MCVYIYIYMDTAYRFTLGPEVYVDMTHMAYLGLFGTPGLGSYVKGEVSIHGVSLNPGSCLCGSF